jgi:dTDP-4-dehydrorhamnose reductase
MRDGKQTIITGARGMLGTDCLPAFTEKWGGDSVESLGRDALDITNPLAVRQALEKYRPRFVVNAAAYTNVDRAESEPSEAELLNVTAPEILAEECARIGAKLIHFSTDQVFDGSGHHPRTETDPPNPLNVYARTKWEGEKKVLQHSDHLVLRVQWLYGRKKDRFTLLRDKEVFSPFSDQFGAPTWTLHLAATVAELASRDAKGLFHFAYDDYASWAEVFEFVKEVMGYSVRLEPKATASVNLPAKRPLFSVMSNRKLLEFLGQPSMGSWKMALTTFLSGVRH